MRNKVFLATRPQHKPSFLVLYLKKLSGDWWYPKKCSFPYPKGYAVYNRRRRTFLETGLNKTQAEEICRRLNWNN